MRASEYNIYTSRGRCLARRAEMKQQGFCLSGCPPLSFLVLHHPPSLHTMVALEVPLGMKASIPFQHFTSLTPLSFTPFRPLPQFSLFTSRRLYRRTHRESALCSRRVTMQAVYMGNVCPHPRGIYLCR